MNSHNTQEPRTNVGLILQKYTHALEPKFKDELLA